LLPACRAASSDDALRAQAAHLFRAFDSDASGLLCIDEFVTAVDGVLHGDWRAQLALLFKIFDRDGSGGVDKTELAAVVRDALHAERLQARDDVISELVDAVFRDYDKEGGSDGILSFAEFAAWLGHEPQARCADPCCAVLCCAVCAFKHCVRALTRHHPRRR
jgi:Ca2+-binding EF-hand superfamily protein